MEERKAKVIFNKSGGTATGKKAITNRITIPTSWINEMGISLDERNVSIKFDGVKIVIEKFD